MTKSGQTAEQLQEVIDRQNMQIDLLKTRNNELLLELADCKAQLHLAEISGQELRREQMREVFEEEHRLIDNLRLQLMVKQDAIDKQKKNIQVITMQQQKRYDAQLAALKAFFDRTLETINREELAKSQIERYEELVLQLQRDKQLLAEQNSALSAVNQTGISQLARSRAQGDPGDLGIEEFQ